MLIFEPGGADDPARGGRARRRLGDVAAGHRDEAGPISSEARVSGGGESSFARSMTSAASSHRPSHSSGSARLMARNVPDVRDSPYSSAVMTPCRATSAAASCSPAPSSRCDSLIATCSRDL